MVAASVRIAKYEPQREAQREMIALGSGVCVATRRYTDAIGNARGETLILTARHVLADGIKAIVVTFPAGKSYRYATVEAIDPAADLAAIVISSPDGNDPVIPLAASAMNQGESIWLVGYPRGSGPLARVGRVLGSNGLTDKRVPVTSLSVYSDHGDSGCGVFRPDRTLVGILWGGSGNHDAAVTGIADIRNFLETRCARWFPGRRPTPTTPNNPAPLNPPLQPPVVTPSGPGVPPSQPTDPGLSAALADLRATQAKIQADLEELRKRPTTPAVSAEPGKDGRDGKDGLPGKDADVSALSAMLAEKLAAYEARIVALEKTAKPITPAPTRVRVEPVPVPK